MKNQELLINTMAGAILLLENFYELEGTLLYSKEVKMTGNKFNAELKKRIIPLEQTLQDSGEIQEMGDYIKVIENIIGTVATLNMKDLQIMTVFLEQLKAGNVIDVDDDTFNKLKNS
ncbi:hypothetical protein N9924_00155 [bacterium]|nr:hypothetical protein [bacterium]